MHPVKNGGITASGRPPTGDHRLVDPERDRSSGDQRAVVLAPVREGIFLAETIFGTTLTLSSGRIIPTRWIGEQHVREDLGVIPSFADWARTIRPKPWMGRAQRIETEVDPFIAADAVRTTAGEPRPPGGEPTAF